MKGYGYIQKNINGNWDLISCYTGDILVHDLTTDECHSMFNGSPFINLKENGIEDGKKNFRSKDRA